MVKGRGGGALYIEGFSRGGFFFNSIDPAQAQDGVEIRKKKTQNNNNKYCRCNQGVIEARGSALVLHTDGAVTLFNSNLTVSNRVDSRCWEHLDDDNDDHSACSKSLETYLPFRKEFKKIHVKQEVGIQRGHGS